MVEAAKGVIVLERDVRTLTRTFLGSSTLSHSDTKWMLKGAEIQISERKRMLYDHALHYVAQVLNSEEERFLIILEMLQTPWFLVHSDHSPVLILK